jgi:bifunctional non-homologous end joining protein LigD
MKPLQNYRAKRNFSKTPEPRGKPAARARRHEPAAPMFCVQKHQASHLHYDFRLEHHGVLLSWAVPKGPSLDPADKRLAMHVEDHPLEYGEFEGVIPEGYGAGVVMLWDRGTWHPEVPDVDAALAKGELKFALDGVKLKGSWALVRIGRNSESNGSGGKQSWLLIKHRDDWSGPIDVTAVAPLSVKSFGSFADIIAKEKPDEWASHKPARGGAGGDRFARIIEKVKQETPMVKKKSAAVKKRAHAAAAVALQPAKAKGVSITVPITRPEKVLYPSGFTKGEVVDYYRKISPVLLPYLEGRALTLKRYPNGTAQPFFYEKNCPSHRPPWVKTAAIAREGGEAPTEHCLVNDLPTLLWVANLASLELHVPLAKAADPLRPLVMVFDLDPGPGANLLDCCRVALRMKELLGEMGLESFVKTSGSKGLHLYVPLNTAATFEATKPFAKHIAMTLEREDPQRVTSNMSKSVRKGKVFIDWSQNDRHKTTVCVYSLRARETPNVSTPVSWPEIRKVLKGGKTGDLEFEAGDMLKRIGRKGDMFADALRLKQWLPKMTAL